MKALSWINFILGIWLIIVGFAVSMPSRPVMAEEVVLGAIIACLAMVSLTRPSSIVSWLIGIAGLWTLLAPAAMNYTTLHFSRANDVVVGIVVLILGVANAIYYQRPIRTHA